MRVVIMMIYLNLQQLHTSILHITKPFKYGMIYPHIQLMVAGRLGAHGEVAHVPVAPELRAGHDPVIVPSPSNGGNSCSGSSSYSITCTDRQCPG